MVARLVRTGPAPETDRDAHWWLARCGSVCSPHGVVHGALAAKRKQGCGAPCIHDHVVTVQSDGIRTGRGWRWQCVWPMLKFNGLLSQRASPTAWVGVLITSSASACLPRRWRDEHLRCMYVCSFDTRLAVSLALLVMRRRTRKCRRASRRGVARSGSQSVTYIHACMNAPWGKGAVVGQCSG